MLIDTFQVDSPNVKYTEEFIESSYRYETTEVFPETREGKTQWKVKPVTQVYNFRTQRRVPRLGYETRCSCRWSRS